MPLTKVHIFTYDEMQEAIKKLNEFHGLPVDGGQSYFSESSFTKIDDNYYIQYDEEWTKVLGNPTEIKL